MKTLVIHPDDRSTDFLKLIYQGKDFTVINEAYASKKAVMEEIKKHDRIIMMGHGTPYGLLFTPISSSNQDIVDLLRTKSTISIWCNSDQFYIRNNLADGNLHTKMVISEVSEAKYVLGHSPLNKEELLENMNLLAKTIGECIDYEPHAMIDYILDHYVGDDEITQYNRKSMILI